MTMGANLEDIKPEVSNMSLDLSSRTRNFRCFDELFYVVRTLTSPRRRCMGEVVDETEVWRHIQDGFTYYE